MGRKASGSHEDSRVAEISPFRQPGFYFSRTKMARALTPELFRLQIKDDIKAAMRTK